MQTFLYICPSSPTGSEMPTASKERPYCTLKIAVKSFSLVKVFTINKETPANAETSLPVFFLESLQIFTNLYAHIILYGFLNDLGMLKGIDSNGESPS